MGKNALWVDELRLSGEGTACGRRLVGRRGLHDGAVAAQGRQGGRHQEGEGVCSEAFSEGFSQGGGPSRKKAMRLPVVVS